MLPIKTAEFNTMMSHSPSGKCHARLALLLQPINITYTVYNSMRKDFTTLKQYHGPNCVILYHNNPEGISYIYLLPIDSLCNIPNNLAGFFYLIGQCSVFSHSVTLCFGNSWTRLNFCFFSQSLWLIYSVRGGDLGFCTAQWDKQGTTWVGGSCLAMFTPWQSFAK